MEYKKDHKKPPAEPYFVCVLWLMTHSSSSTEFWGKAIFSEYFHDFQTFTKTFFTISHILYHNFGGIFSSCSWSLEDQNRIWITRGECVGVTGWSWLLAVLGHRSKKSQTIPRQQLGTAPLVTHRCIALTLQLLPIPSAVQLLCCMLCSYSQYFTGINVSFVKQIVVPESCNG